jgi:hypothetical protein
MSNSVVEMTIHILNGTRMNTPAPAAQAQADEHGFFKHYPRKSVFTRAPLPRERRGAGVHAGAGVRMP